MELEYGSAQVLGGGQALDHLGGQARLPGQSLTQGPHQGEELAVRALGLDLDALDIAADDHAQGLGPPAGGQPGQVALEPAGVVGLQEALLHEGADAPARAGLEGVELLEEGLELARQGVHVQGHGKEHEVGLVEGPKRLGAGASVAEPEHAGPLATRPLEASHQLLHEHGGVALGAQGGVDHQQLLAAGQGLGPRQGQGLGEGDGLPGGGALLASEEALDLVDDPLHRGVGGGLEDQGLAALVGEALHPGLDHLELLGFVPLAGLEQGGEGAQALVAGAVHHLAVDHVDVGVGQGDEAVDGGLEQAAHKARAQGGGQHHQVAADPGLVDLAQVVLEGALARGLDPAAKAARAPAQPELGQAEDPDLVALGLETLGQRGDGALERAVVAMIRVEDGDAGHGTSRGSVSIAYIP